MKNKDMNVRKLVTLSHVISLNTPSYGDRDRVIIRANTSISKGDSSNTSSWTFSNNHIGTHIDAPHHFCVHGEKTYEIPISNFFFDRVQLIELPCQEARLIGPTEFLKLGQVIDRTVEMILIRTGYEQYRGEEKYWSDNPGLSAELADYLREYCPYLRCVGFDFISLTSWKYRKEGRKSHRAFLCPNEGRKSILVIEDMSLKMAESNIKNVIVAPLFVEDGNGAAVTVFAGIN